MLMGPVLDLQMVLWVQSEYNLDSLGAGLVFIGAVVPGFFVRCACSSLPASC